MHAMNLASNALVSSSYDLIDPFLALLNHLMAVGLRHEGKITHEGLVSRVDGHPLVEVVDMFH